MWFSALPRVLCGGRAKLPRQRGSAESDTRTVQPNLIKRPTLTEPLHPRCVSACVVPFPLASPPQLLPREWKKLQYNQARGAGWCWWRGLVARVVPNGTGRGYWILPLSRGVFRASFFCVFACWGGEEESQTRGQCAADITPPRLPSGRQSPNNHEPINSQSPPVQALVERFKHVPEVKRIVRHKHVPKQARGAGGGSAVPHQSCATNAVSAPPRGACCRRRRAPSPYTAIRLDSNCDEEPNQSACERASSASPSIRSPIRPLSVWTPTPPTPPYPQVKRAAELRSTQESSERRKRGNEAKHSAPGKARRSRALCCAVHRCAT